ncbi:hypothetical protein DPMN_095606, partial [Dreissena polymorpha]
DQQSEQKDDDHFLEVTRKKQVKAPAHLREPTSLVPAVEIPHPGASYNPGYEEYQPTSLVPAVEIPHPGASYNPGYEEYQEEIVARTDGQTDRRTDGGDNHNIPTFFSKSVGIKILHPGVSYNPGYEEYQDTRNIRIRGVSGMKPTSLVPAVEIPHPRASYNPGYEDNQDLLKKAHITEEKKLQEEERIKRALDSKFPSAADAPTEATNLLEMSAGLFDEDSDNDTAPGDLEKLSVNPPVRRENKKDERRRKKEKARKEKLEAAKRQKEKRIKDNNFNRLRSIKREIKAEEAESEVKAKKRAEQRAQEAFKTKRLSKNKFVEPDLEVKLSDELVGSLRELRPEGHLLLDRFNSLMKRNMLEPRGAPGRKQKRKYKPRVFEKKSHKDVK